MSDGNVYSNNASSSGTNGEELSSVSDSIHPHLIELVPSHFRRVCELSNGGMTFSEGIWTDPSNYKRLCPISNTYVRFRTFQTFPFDFVCLGMSASDRSV